MSEIKNQETFSEIEKCSAMKSGQNPVVLTPLTDEVVDGILNSSTADSDVDQELNLNTLDDLTKIEVPELPHFNREINILTKEIAVRNIDDLKTHPLCEHLYANKEDQIEDLAISIKDNGLINRIVINPSNEILSGVLRHLAMKKLDAEEIEVYVIDIKPEDTLEFIIISNHQREKTIFDKLREIQSLYEKYSPGQGNRESSSTNTIKKIAEITGYTPYQISVIRKIDATYPKFFDQIHEGFLTLNGAYQGCETVENLKILENMLNQDIIDNELKYDIMTDAENVGFVKTFDKKVKDLCKGDQYEGLSTEECFKLLVNPDAEITGKSKTKKPAGETMECPCCKSKVRVTSELQWLREYKLKIEIFIKKLKESKEAEIEEEENKPKPLC